MASEVLLREPAAAVAPAATPVMGAIHWSPVVPKTCKSLNVQGIQPRHACHLPRTRLARSKLRTVKRQLTVVGSGLAGIGLTSLLGYLIATQASGVHDAPAWPYWLCAAFAAQSLRVLRRTARNN